MKLFVPGRICLFGEHTDWAGGYRRINSDLPVGYTLITGTNQGLYAEVKTHPSKLIFKASANSNGEREIFEINMDREILLNEAEKGGVFSYVAGVAYQILTHYQVQGVEIDNYLTDLPVKKGLSSSAAVCVMVVRAFNKLYNLKMTTRGEMEFAYWGEITTPSRCGRMDQGCAYGSKPVMMSYDGDKLDVREIKVAKELCFLIVDLKAGKDTREILKKLNQCYPFAENELHRNVQKYLGEISPAITCHAVKALEKGDAEKIGQLMKQSQNDFDQYVAPACPNQLTAPVLHRVLKYPPIQNLIYGGKGVGSQGDGTAQFIVKDQEAMEKVKAILEKDLQLSCLELVVKPYPKLRKAVIPAAGFGTRLFPASKALKKEMFPVLDKDGRIKPAIQIIIEEAIQAGIEEIGLIVQKSGAKAFEEYFKTALPVQNYNKLPPKDRDYHDYLLSIGSRIHFIEQDIQSGLGHAVYCTREWVNDEPFLLLLGDHLHDSAAEKKCVQQLAEVYEKIGHSVVSVIPTPIEQIGQFGCIGGKWREDNSILTITEFAEKPSEEYARENLQIEGLDENTYLTLFGQYIITPQVFAYLEENIRHDFRERGEFQLTGCLDKLRKEEGFSALLATGKRYDIGIPQGYRETVMEFGG